MKNNFENAETVDDEYWDAIEEQAEDICADEQPDELDGMYYNPSGLKTDEEEIMDAVSALDCMRSQQLQNLAERLKVFQNPQSHGAFEVILAMLQYSGYRFIVENETLRVYDSTLGYFRPFTANGPRSFCKFLEEVAPLYWKPLYQTKLAEHVESYVKDHPASFGFRPKAKHASIDPLEYINFRNGTFSIRTGKLHKHSDKFRALNVVDADFVEGEWEMPHRVLCFLDHLGNGENGMKALLQVGGLAISPCRNLQVGAFLIGEGGSGKGVFTDILRALVPADSQITFSLEGLSQRFALNGLETAQLAICPELNTAKAEAADVRILKSLISGDKLLVERKYKNPKEVHPHATVVCCGNAFPHGLLDDSGAMQRRIVLIKTGSTIQNRNPNLLKELLVYRNFLATAFARAAAEIYRGEPFYSDSLPAVTSSPRAHLSDMAEEWLLANVIANEQGELNVTGAFKDFIADNPEAEKMDNRTFGSIVARLFPSPKERLSDGSYVRYGYILRRNL